MQFRGYLIKSFPIGYALENMSLISFLCVCLDEDRMQLIITVGRTCII